MGLAGSTCRVHLKRSIQTPASLAALPLCSVFFSLFPKRCSSRPFSSERVFAVHLSAQSCRSGGHTKPQSSPCQRGKPHRSKDAAGKNVTAAPVLQTELREFAEERRVGCVSEREWGALGKERGEVWHGPSV